MRNNRSTNINFALLTVFAFAMMFWACKDPAKPQPTDSFDRTAMLTFWAEQQIIPALEQYGITLVELETAKNDFIQNKKITDFELLKTAYLNAYLAWQTVAMFNIGEAEAIGYRNYINTYPTDVALIESNVANETYNLELPSNFVAQGFPALDYLLFGLLKENEDYLQKLTQSQYLNYLSDLIDRLDVLNKTVLNDWQTNFKNTFINNNSSSATASTDKLINDYLFYYEKYFRAGKIAIPAGVFSGNTLSHAVEAPYSGIYSKQLCLKAFEAIQQFFDGVSFDGLTTGPSLKQYLQSVAAANNTEDVAQKIINQWQIAEENILELDNNFKQQVETDNPKMLAAYDEIQKAVVIMKVEMMQALNIQIDYVDADGD